MRIAMLVAVALFTSTPALADDKLIVKEIPTKDLKIAMPENGKPTSPTEITSADELAKSPALKDAADEVKKHVNFEKEKLVFFAWTGSSGDDLTAIDLLGRPSLIAFRHTPGAARDQRPHAWLFVMSKEAGVFVYTNDEARGILPRRNPEIPGLRELPTSGLKIRFPVDPGGAANPEIITSAAQLSESPELKDAAEEIKKLVDFEKEKLVLVAWLGSVSDQFAIEWDLPDTRIVVSFRVRPGSSLDYSERIRLFVIPKDMGVRTAGR